MGKSIWVIEEGEYSDYGVTGVFSTKENADFVREMVGGEVSEWVLDPGVDELRAGRKLWNVRTLRDGTVEYCKTMEISGYSLKDSGPKSARIWRRTQAPAYQGKDVQDCLMAFLWAKTSTQAIKSANEIRAQFIARGDW